VKSDSGNDAVTLRGAPLVTAPGKLFLAGEYTVLRGGSAVIAAVDREATAQFIPGFSPASKVVAEAVKATLDFMGEAAEALPRGSVLVNSKRFTEGDRKLGVGSSAATAAATVGAVLAYCGYDLDDHRNKIFELADKAHRAAQGGVGSGGDIAAAVFGGFLRFQRPEVGLPETDELSAPSGLALVTLFAGRSASTRHMIESVNQLETDKPPLFAWLMDELKSAAGAFGRAFDSGSVSGVIDSAQACFEAMRELGRMAGVPIVTDEVNAGALQAQQLGGALKPSGAGGGGDMAVAFFPSVDEAMRFAESAPPGLRAIPLRLGVAGLRRRQPGIVGAPR